MQHMLKQGPAWKPPKPWGVTKDGDLLQVLWQSICSKGSASIRASKTKGHATALDIERGISTLHEARGNG